MKFGLNLSLAGVFSLLLLSSAWAQTSAKPAQSGTVKDPLPQTQKATDSKESGDAKAHSCHGSGGKSKCGHGHKHGACGKKKGCGGHRKFHGPWGHFSGKGGFFIISPRYFSNSNNRRQVAFLNNGFGASNNAMFGFRALFGRRYHSGIESGFMISRGEQSRGGANQEAKYDYMWFGLHAAYDVLKHVPKIELQPTLALGGGLTRLEVFSANQANAFKWC